MWTLKNKLVNIEKRNWLAENKLVVTSGETKGRKGKIGLGDKEVQTVIYKISYNRDFPGGSVAKTLRFQCREPGFDA